MLLDFDLVRLPVNLGVGILKPGFAKYGIILVQMQYIKLLFLGLVVFQIESDIQCLAFALRG